MRRKLIGFVAATALLVSNVGCIKDALMHPDEAQGLVRTLWSNGLDWGVLIVELASQAGGFFPA